MGWKGRKTRRRRTYLCAGSGALHHSFPPSFQENTHDLAVFVFEVVLWGGWVGGWIEEIEAVGMRC